MTFARRTARLGWVHFAMRRATEHTFCEMRSSFRLSLRLDACAHSNLMFRILRQWRPRFSVFRSKLHNRLGCLTLHGGLYFLTSTTRAQMSEQGINNPVQVCFGIASWHVSFGRLAHVCIRPRFALLAACAALCFRNRAWGLRALQT